MRLLVVEDDPAVSAAVRRLLVLHGYDVATATTGDAAAETLAGERFRAVVMDGMLPGIDGLELCRRLRAAGDNTPVLMLTARDSVEDRVAGLEAGADDYLVKPFANAELLARVRALLRRVQSEGSGETSSAPAIMRFLDLELDCGAMVARRGGRSMQLRRTEFILLETLMRNPRRVMERDTIFREVWGHEAGPISNSLEVYVGYLRRKLEADAAPRLIHTVRGVGYVLREDEP